MTSFNLDWLKRSLPPAWLMAAGQLRDHIPWGERDRGLYAFYDLAVSPPGFDFLAFLIRSEIDRRARGAAYVQVVIVPGPHDGFRVTASKEQNVLAKDNLRWRLRQVVAPLGWLLPSCRAVTVCATREEGRRIWRRAGGRVFPRQYSVSVPNKASMVVDLVKASKSGVKIPSLRAPAAARHWAKQWLIREAGGRQVVSITLRESSYGLERNSNVKAWGEFARGLDKEKYLPVVIRDFERALEPVPDLLTELMVWTAPVWNLELRAAFYELAWLNLFISNGPAELAMFDDKIRYILFKVVTENYPSTTTKFLKEQIGLEPGESVPWATKYQKSVWEDDDLVVIQREFERMASRIESDQELD